MTELDNVSRLLVVTVETNEEGEARWVLIGEPCHNGDIVVSFDTKPLTDPLPEVLMDDADVSDDDPRWDAYDTWLETGREAMSNLLSGHDARSAWRLVEDLREAGYNPERDGDAEMWLYSRIGAVIAENEVNPSAADGA